MGDGFLEGEEISKKLPLVVDKGADIRYFPRPVTIRKNQYQHIQSDRMRGVTMKKGEPVDRALKRLKTKLDSEGILEEMRRRRSFETPTERRQRKLRTASKRNKVRWRYTSASSAAAAAEADNAEPRG